MQLQERTKSNPKDNTLARDALQLLPLPISKPVQLFITTSALDRSPQKTLNDKTQNVQTVFSFAELLIVGIIIGIFAAITLPAFLSCGNKAKLFEAKQTIGSINRAQQAFYIENNAFSQAIGPLGLGIATETSIYRYSIQAEEKATFAYAIPIKSQEKSYVGAVLFVKVPNQADPSHPPQPTTMSILCEATKPGPIRLPKPFLKAGQPTCPEGTRSLTTYSTSFMAK